MLDLKTVIKEYRAIKSRPDQMQQRIVELEEILAPIQQDVESNSQLLSKVAEDLEYSIEDQIANEDLGSLSQGFYHDCDVYIRTCALLNKNHENAAELIRQVADFHLDFFDGVTNEQFKPYQREIIERIVVMLRTFNRLIPGNSDLLMLQSEAELLMANYMRQYIEIKIEKSDYSGKLINQIRELVKFSYESAVKTGHNALHTIDEEGQDDVLDLLEDCNAAYADWFLQIGDKKQAQRICDEHYQTNPYTNIHYDLNLRHPEEDRLRRKVLQNDRQKQTRENDENKLFGLYIKTYSYFLDDDFVEGSRLLGLLAELHPSYAQEISRRFSGGQPALKTGDWADNLLDKLDSDPFGEGV